MLDYGSEEAAHGELGVKACKPTHCRNHTYQYPLAVGRCPAHVVMGVISVLRQRWLAKDYLLLSHNCCHF